MNNKIGSTVKKIIDYATPNGDICKTLSSFYECLHGALPVDRMSLIKLDADRNTIHMIAQASATGSERTNFSYPFFEEAMDLIKKGILPDIYIINDPGKDPFGQAMAKRSGNTDWSLMILIVDNHWRTFAGVSFIVAGRNQFTEKHSRMVRGLKDEHKRLLDLAINDLERKSSGPLEKDPIEDKHDFFRDVTKRLCGHLDLEIGALHCLQYLSRFMPATALTVFQLKQDLVVDRVIVWATGFLLNFHHPMISPTGEMLVSSKFTGFPGIKIVNDPDLEPAMNPYNNLYGSDWSGVTMLLFNKKIPIGAASLISEGKNRYSQEHLKLFSMIHDPFALALSNNIEHNEVLRLQSLIEADKQDLQGELRYPEADDIIGCSRGLKGVMENARLVAGQDSPVLLSGETGVGKEIIANFIHRQSPRKEGPLIKVNCGAIPETLVDSELFGHEKGAFTGAESRKMGRFERADGGTIFLDEIAELPLNVQARMLRVLQYKIIERVGGTDGVPVDVRIIAATHRNLEEMVGDGQFREDLWFRLNVFPIRIPPLRSRRSDIPALVDHFIEKKLRELKYKHKPSVTSEALGRLTAYEWPGNIRELENVVERDLILSKGEALVFQGIDPRAPAGNDPDRSFSEDDDLKMDKVYARHINSVLALTNEKIEGPGGAAELLKIKPSTLRNRMAKLGIVYGRKKETPTR